MKKLLGVFILLTITVGITYGLKSRIALVGDNDAGEKASAALERSDRAAGSDAAEKERASKNGRGRRVSVEVAEVSVGKVAEQLNYVGSLQPETAVEVFSKVEGRIEQIRVDVGAWIQKGDWIAQIEEAEIVQTVREAEASLRVAQATLKDKLAEMRNLERELDRAKRLFEKKFISRQEFDAAETRHYSAVAQTELAKAQVAQQEAILRSARIKLSDCKIHSPLTGYVAKRFLDAGTMVKTTTPILSLVDIDPVTMLIAVVERDYARVRVGLPASITVDAFPGRTFQGKVVRLSPVLDRETRTADVEIEIANPKKLLKPGMFARASLPLQKKEKGLVVPQAAIVRRGAAVGVFKLDDGRRVTFVPLRVGASYDGKVEVAGAIAEGDRVVTLGAHLLEDGARVQVAKSPGS